MDIFKNDSVFIYADVEDASLLSATKLDWCTKKRSSNFFQSPIAIMKR